MKVYSKSCTVDEYTSKLTKLSETVSGIKFDIKVIERGTINELPEIAVVFEAESGSETRVSARGNGGLPFDKSRPRRRA